MSKQKPLVLAVGAAVSALAALSTAPAIAQKENDEPLFEELVVTGSRIQRANLCLSRIPQVSDFTAVP